MVKKLTCKLDHLLNCHKLQEGKNIQGYPGRRKELLHPKREGLRVLHGSLSVAGPRRRPEVGLGNAQEALPGISQSRRRLPPFQGRAPRHRGTDKRLNDAQGSSGLSKNRLGREKRLGPPSPVGPLSRPAPAPRRV